MTKPEVLESLYCWMFAEAEMGMLQTAGFTDAERETITALSHLFGNLGWQTDPDADMPMIIGSALMGIPSFRKHIWEK